MFDADAFPRLALVLDDVATDDGWTASGRLHVKRTTGDGRIEVPFEHGTISYDPDTGEFAVT